MTIHRVEWVSFLNYALMVLFESFMDYLTRAQAQYGYEGEEGVCECSPPYYWLGYSWIPVFA